MTSKFRTLPYLLIAILIILAAFVLYIISSIIFTNGTVPPLAVVVFALLFGLMLFWFAWVELRKVMSRVIVDDKHIKVKYWGGLGKSHCFEYNLLDGYKTTVLPSTYDNYEYMYIMINEKTIIILSAFYHKNYKELRDTLKHKVQYIGYEPLKIKSYIKHMLS
jgi:hypothetical protein